MTDTVVPSTLQARVHEMPLRGKLHAGPRGCLAVLAAQQGAAPYTDINNNALGALLEVSHNTLDKYIRELLGMGLITRTPHAGKMRTVVVTAGATLEEEDTDTNASHRTNASDRNGPSKKTAPVQRRLHPVDPRHRRYYQQKGGDGRVVQAEDAMNYPQGSLIQVTCVQNEAAYFGFTPRYLATQGDPIPLLPFNIPFVCEPGDDSWDCHAGGTHFRLH